MYVLLLVPLLRFSRSPTHFRTGVPATGDKYGRKSRTPRIQRAPAIIKLPTYFHKVLSTTANKYPKTDDRIVYLIQHAITARNDTLNNALFCTVVKASNLKQYARRRGIRNECRICRIQSCSTFVIHCSCYCPGLCFLRTSKVWITVCRISRRFRSRAWCTLT